MKPKHYDVIIDKNYPFLNCKLNREPYGQVLTEILKNYSDSFVLAINNEWGTGKTTFIKMWEQHLRNEKFKTLYFNAWENDFEKDSLVALISELEKISEKKTNAKFKKVIEKAAPLAKALVLHLLKNQIEKHVGKENLNTTISEFTGFGLDCLQSQIQEYTKKKKSIEEFKSSLEEFISSTEEKPIVFIIDELDRCRPNYAVEVLEQIKHLFTVRGIVFVLSIDKSQLGHAVRGVYGCEQIDSDEYLRRFIDIEYSLPEPRISDFVVYLYEYFQFNEFINSDERYKCGELRNDGNNIINFATFLFTLSNLSLRNQEKIFAHARLALNLFNSNNYLHPELFILLVYLRHNKYGIYRDIRANKYSTQELVAEIENIIPKTVDDTKILSFIWTESLLLKFYTNENIDNVVKLYDHTESGEKRLLFKSRFDSNEHTNQFLISFDHIRSQRFFNNKLSILINKIDLTEGFKDR